MSEAKTSSKAGRNLIILLAIVLGVLHQDMWLWDSDTLVLGFIPIGLAYHALYSIIAAGLWILAIKLAWPHDLEAMAAEPAGGGSKTPEEKSGVTPGHSP